jgi:hypothetical protein
VMLLYFPSPHSTMTMMMMIKKYWKNKKKEKKRRKIRLYKRLLINLCVYLFRTISVCVCVCFVSGGK